MARIDSFLQVVADQGASDLHFCSGNQPIVRHDGTLLALPFRKLSPNETRRFLFEILSPEQREKFERVRELDFVYALDNGWRFRANYYVQTNGVAGVFRVIKSKPPTMAAMELPSMIKKLLHHKNGIVLVTGPTGSGKTTTLAAMINEINATVRRHIITIEDPIEFVHQPNKCLVTQRQVGVHVPSFSDALRSALREAPDVIVVGEMRDHETISLALTAAETGALVFGTLHTNTAATTIDRIIDATPEEARDQTRAALSVLVRGIVAQQLLKRSSGEGRVAALEVLFNSTAVANLIRDDKIHQLEALLRNADGRAEGNLGLDMCLYKHARAGVITHEEALRYAKSREHVAKLLAEMPEEM